MAEVDRRHFTELYSKDLDAFLDPKDDTRPSLGTSAANKVVMIEYKVFKAFRDRVFGQQTLRRNKYVPELLPWSNEQARKGLGIGIGTDLELLKPFSGIFEAQGPNERASLSPESSLGTAADQSQMSMRRIKGIFAAGESEIFEAGMESKFSEGLVETVKQYGQYAMNAIAELIPGDNTEPEVAAEALCVLGDLDDATTYGSRSSLLIESLESKSSRVREGAILGLSCLQDPRSIPLLKEARENEPYGFLRQYIKQVLQILEERVNEEI